MLIYAAKSGSDSDYLGYIFFTLITSMFYAPNILQTLLIVLYWPISFYFVKTCEFILVLSLTRNVSYFTDKVPNEFLATSTTFTQHAIQCLIRRVQKSTNKNQKNVETKKKLNELIKMMKINGEIKELIKTIIEEVGNKEVEGQEKLEA